MAEGRDDSQEKTEQATPKRQLEAKEKGQVSRSRELTTMAVLIMASTSLFMIGDNIINSILHIMRNCFVISREHIFSVGHMPNALADAGANALLGVAPLFFILSVAAFVAPLAVGGWVFSAKAISFQWDKLDPLKGIKKVFGTKGLMELVKALAKFVLIIGLALLLLWLELDELLLLGQNGLRSGLAEASAAIIWACVLFSATTILIAVVDVPFQLWEHSKQLKMSKQEVKDEMKETEGRPEVKAHIREMQQQLANQRMLEDVPKADVIITNPTHYAVALLYEQEKMGAPRVIARGVDFMAQRIRLIANQHEVTVFQAPLLARALYYNSKIGKEIPAGLYLAIAQILAYVYQLRAKRKDPHIFAPARPGDLPIPDDYKNY